MASSVGEIKPFLLKLWKILEDETLSDLICWDTSGLSFHIFNSYEFSRVILSRFFKSTAISSFVRQLNIYGFKKLHDRNGESNADHMEFSHTCFRRDHWELLRHIVRKPPSGKKRAVESMHAPVVEDLMADGIEQSQSFGDQPTMVMVAERDLTELVEELRALRVSHSSMSDTVSELAKDKEVLWNEVTLLRSSHLKQQQNVSRLVQFLLTMMQQTQSSNHHHHQKHHHPRVGATATGGGPPKAKMVPLEVDGNPLALVSGSNCDVLGAIQSDLMLEELDFINCSSILPPTDLRGSLESLDAARASKRTHFTSIRLLDNEPLQLSGGIDQPLYMWPPRTGSSGSVRLNTRSASNEYRCPTPAPVLLSSSPASNVNRLALVQRDARCQQLVPAATTRRQQMNFLELADTDTIPPNILMDAPITSHQDDFECLDDEDHLFDRYINLPIGVGSGIPTDDGMDELSDYHQENQQLLLNDPYQYVNQEEGEELIEDGVQLEEISGCLNTDSMPELLFSPANR